MGETNWIALSFHHQASTLVLYLFSVSDCVRFICKIMKSYLLGRKIILCAMGSQFRILNR